MLRAITSLLPVLPAAVLVGVYGLATCMGAEWLLDHGWGRPLWVSVSFALYYLMLAIPVWWLGYHPLWGSLVGVVTPGVLVLHAAPGLNEHREGIGAIAVADVAEWVVHAPGLLVWGGMRSVAHTRARAIATRPDSLLQSLTDPSTFHTDIEAMAWHDEHIWMVVHNGTDRFTVVTDAEGTLVGTEYWGQARRLPMTGRIDALITGDDGLLLQGLVHLYRLTPDDLVTVAEVSGAVAAGDQILALDPRPNDSGRLVHAFGFDGQPLSSSSTVLFRKVLGLAPGTRFQATPTGAVESAIAFNVFPYGADGPVGFEPRTVVFGTDGLVQALPGRAEHVYALQDGTFLTADQTGVRWVGVDGQTQKHVKDNRYPLGIWEGELIARDDGFAVTSTHLEPHGGWLEGRFDRWSSGLHPAHATHWIETPSGRVLAFGPHDRSHQEWASDLQGPIAPLIRLRPDGAPDPGFNPRHPLP